MKVNEIFHSLQGEGYHTGSAVVFLRLSGCNLKCAFCDTDHIGGKNMTEEEIVEEVNRYGTKHVVITGGEPAMQLTSTLVDKLHQAGLYVQIETNGTLLLPPGIDWVTCSPKTGRKPVLADVDELKVVIAGHDTDPSIYDNIKASHRFVQPCDHGDAKLNAESIKQAVDYVKSHPQWRLSLQTHKLINIP